MSVLLFAGESYYPAGGWRDLVGVFTTIDAAKARVDDTRSERTYGVGEFSGYWKWSGTVISYEFDWAHIVVDGVMVLEWDRGEDMVPVGTSPPARWVDAQQPLDHEGRGAE